VVPQVPPLSLFVEQFFRHQDLGRAAMSSDVIYDIAVIGGGINGAGIAADAAGRGLKVCLLEQADLGAATSSASTKLIHGGLRYLEHFEFSLVRDALQERERLLNAAPHLISPLRIVLPHVDGMRPRWLLRAGLFLYDHLARRRTIPASQSVRFAKDPSGLPLNADVTRGFAYWDCWVDDARLVVLNARAAQQKGAHIQTRARVVGYHQDTENTQVWKIETDTDSGKAYFCARAIVNAAGPWADKVAALEQQTNDAFTEFPNQKLRLVKGSHLVVPRHPGMNDGYLLQNFDGRVVFALPYQDRFTLIGTTDEPFEGNPASPECSETERDYLLKVYNRFFVRRLSPDDVAHHFSGVRPLYDDDQGDPSKVTRDYRLELRDNPDDRPFLLTVLGGKLTTYRCLAQEAVDMLEPCFVKRGVRVGQAWTANHPLPGGALHDGVTRLINRLAGHYPAIDNSVITDLVSRYGTSTFELLGEAKDMSDLGSECCSGLFEREVRYLRDVEWAQTAEDVLWRRTKFGLQVPKDKQASVVDAITTCLQS